jgi:hypothetical protein
MGRLKINPVESSVLLKVEPNILTLLAFFSAVKTLTILVSNHSDTFCKPKPNINLLGQIQTMLHEVYLGDRQGKVNTEDILHS